ncbi:hypothetical protein [Puniceibacterium sp. IMCC21224]|uniref:hypothetical protein n=1 Tax=Puniceibacterium sp. IMCC21224 TaxID=1618204 RepID=UPI00064DF34D|nr:hypothetical protein [Puniceibacterium sp. IMCC21224]KMK65210.1 hypothetical protein IMCC21224_1140 [Puniceibacterium sp. IMCC21224]
MGLLNPNDAQQMPAYFAAPVPYARLLVLAPGADTLCAIYRDPDLTEMLANPLKADADGRFDLCHVVDGVYRIVVQTMDGQTVLDQDNLAIRSSRSFGVAHGFRTTDEMRADTVLSYTDGFGRQTVSPGGIVSVADGGYSYAVAHFDAVDHHLATAGGVRLYVQPRDNTVTPEQFGADAGYVTTADDTPYIQAAHDFLAARGGGRLLLSRPYRLGSATARGAGLTRSLEFYADDLTIEAHGGARLICDVPGQSDTYHPVMFFGGGKIASGTGNRTTQRCADKTVHAISGPLPKGSRIIPLANASHAAWYQPGDIVYIRTGQLGSDPGSTTEPTAELGQVHTVGASSITLVEGLAHGYAPEYFPDSAMTGPTSGIVTAWPAAYGVCKVTDRVMRGLKILGKLEIDDSSQSRQALTAWGLFDCDFGETVYRYRWLGFGARDALHVRGRLIARHSGAATFAPGASCGFHPGTGCSRWNCDIDSLSPTFSSVLMHQNIGDSAFRIRTRNGEDPADGSPHGAGISVTAGVDDLHLDLDCHMGNLPLPGVHVDVVSKGGVRFGLCRVSHGDSSVSAIVIDAGSVAFTQGITLCGSNKRVSLSGTQSADQALGTMGMIQYLTGVVTHDRPCDLGTLPREAIPLFLSVNVTSAVSGSSNRINVGHTDQGAAYVDQLICGSEGGHMVDIRDTAAGTALNRQQAQDRAVIARCVDATAGAAVVVMAYVIAGHQS